MKTTLDWNEYIKAAVDVASEGTVLLKNDNAALPLKKGERVAVFGRIQDSYYKSGTGSGGMVNVEHVTGLKEALKNTKLVTIDPVLEGIYAEWEKDNPFEQGMGWGQEPWAQKEMPLTPAITDEAASRNDSAICIIGRTAGEDRDNAGTEGSYLLAQGELAMLKAVRGAFKKMTVLLNVGNIIDMSWVDEVKPDAVAYVWQGGMVGAIGTADVLVGNVTPSGRLTDTIAKSIDDYPSTKNFGNPLHASYEEDIYVGYRYFETGAKGKVMYPFGYGLSYTTFAQKAGELAAAINEADPAKSAFTLPVTVTNTGAVPGKDVVQLYVSAPQGKLGKPAKVLVAFAKTATLAPGASETVTLTVSASRFASFDDTGAAGTAAVSTADAWVLEEGGYTVLIGANARDTEAAGTFSVPKLLVLETLHNALHPIEDLNRLKATGDGTFTTENLPASPKRQVVRAKENLGRIKAQLDASPNKAILDKLTDEDLAVIIRGEGMGSPKVTPGTAAAFGGVSDRLKELGVPCGCCTDGPSGLRLDSGVQAFSMPNGTMQACSFNPELVEKLYACTGLEMTWHNIDILLGPGINIHRSPINGRNFEYFSEDPLVAGVMASATIRGLHSSGVSGSLKHFAGNNQELGRRSINCVISARALREIYLKGYEIAVKEAGADVIMTTYGAVNGSWTATSYDLTTTVLRDEWGFKGIVMTDWWADLGDEETGAPSQKAFHQLVRAQNDIYMVVSDAPALEADDDVLASLKNGELTREELLRNADNIITWVKSHYSQDRLEGKENPVDIVNRPETAGSEPLRDIPFYELAEEGGTIPFAGTEAERGKSVIIGLDAVNTGMYEFTFTAKSDASEIAQMPVSLLMGGVPVATLTWNGTGGEYKAQTQQMFFMSKYNMLKLFFAQGGLTFGDISYKVLQKVTREEMFAAMKAKQDAEKAE